ncbi:MAG: photosystem II complex extrinsic protein PsbU [Leptolyngbyaceae cyanobacterium MO_188.B28]|nr:photosystem II complex extrinsic protein PsbU [Leptolyngbyaceae cyanobacterium MO_188.B28]
MKRFIQRLGCWLSLFSLVLASCFGFLGWTQPGFAAEASLQPTMMLADVPLCAESDQKIDLNNANMIAFQDCPGFYPDLAKTIVTNGPYQKVEDVLKTPDLNNRQKELLQANLGSFKVTEQVVPLGLRMPPRTAR